MNWSTHCRTRRSRNFRSLFASGSQDLPPGGLLLSARRTIQPSKLSRLKAAYEAQSGDDQIFVDLHSQTWTLRQVEVALFVHQWWVFHDGEPIGIRGDGRVVQDLDPRRVWPGGDGVELGNGAEITSAVMGNHSLMVRLGQGRNLAKAGDAVGHHDIGLQDGEDILF